MIPFIIRFCLYCSTLLQHLKPFAHGILLVSYLFYDVIYHGPIFRYIFGMTHNFFYRHRQIGKFLNIRYFKSNEWTTNRTDSKLHVGSSVIGYFLGIGIRSDQKIINELKHRQRQNIRNIDLAPYLESIIDQRITIRSLEYLLIYAWVNEICECYEITKPENLEEFAEGMIFLRESMSTLNRNRLFGFFIFLTNIKILWPLRQFWKKLEMPEKLIMFVPFLTTIDTTLFNFVDNPDPIKEFHELFKNVPVQYVPVMNSDGLVILDIVANEANNPGNSVFGAKGMICPGNTLTTMLMKSVANLKDVYQISVEGQIVTEDALVKRIKNVDDVFITFRPRESLSPPFLII